MYLFGATTKLVMCLDSLYLWYSLRTALECRNHLLKKQMMIRQQMSLVRRSRYLSKKRITGVSSVQNCTRRLSLRELSLSLWVSKDLLICKTRRHERSSKTLSRLSGKSYLSNLWNNDSRVRIVKSPLKNSLRLMTYLRKIKWFIRHQRHVHES